MNQLGLVFYIQHWPVEEGCPWWARGWGRCPRLQSPVIMWSHTVPPGTVSQQLEHSWVFWKTTSVQTRLFPLREEPCASSESSYSLTLFLYLINFYWSTIDVQCCVSFCCTAKWISYTYTYTHSFLDSIPIQVITEYWVDFPVLYSRFLLVIYFVYSRVSMSVPISQFIPRTPFLLGNRKFVFYICCTVCLCVYMCVLKCKW